MAPPAVARFAVLADVHANTTAFEAVLDELEREQPDLVVHCGDLTWGPLPLETLELADRLGDRLLCVRGNADRMVVELAARLEEEPDAELTDREAWMVRAHGERGRARLEQFAETVEVAVEGLGRVLCSHGSPRSDEECVTAVTPEERLAEALAGVDADVVVTAHTHLQYERSVLGRTMLNPGSVGMPYEREHGAYWAMLGPGIEHRRTLYDLDEAEARYRATDDPRLELMLELLRTPPSPEEVIEDAERRVFAG
jgi:putative phosphoesterase